MSRPAEKLDITFRTSSVENQKKILFTGADLGRLKLAEVAHVTRDSIGHYFQGQKVNLQRAGAYCGGLPHSFLGLTLVGVELHASNDAYEKACQLPQNVSRYRFNILNSKHLFGTNVPETICVREAATVCSRPCKLTF